MFKKSSCFFFFFCFFKIFLAKDRKILFLTVYHLIVSSKEFGEIKRRNSCQIGEFFWAWEVFLIAWLLCPAVHTVCSIHKFQSRSFLLCLQVAFCDFPESLLCGEVRCIEIEFTNAGKSPLQSLRITSTHPRFFTFGRNSELPKYPYVYQMWASQCSSLSSTLTSTVTGREEFLSLPDVLNVPLPKGELNPGETVSLPMWLRGDDIGGIHEVDLMFYYEPLKHPSSVRYFSVNYCEFCQYINCILLLPHFIISLWSLLHLQYQMTIYLIGLTSLSWWTWLHLKCIN